MGYATALEPSLLYQCNIILFMIKHRKKVKNILITVDLFWPFKIINYFAFEIFSFLYKWCRMLYKVVKLVV